MKKLFRELLEKEGLKEWKIKYSNGGNLCMHSTKTIIIHHISVSMFLHELTHALLSPELDKRMGDITGHHSIWADKYTELVEKYIESKAFKSSKQHKRRLKKRCIKTNPNI